MSLRAEIAAVLCTTEAKLDTRLMAMKLSPTCGRCGGGGRYSFNQIDGDRCFGCGGTGHVAPKEKDLQGILIAAERAAADGTLATYIQMIRDRSFCKTAQKEIFAAWTATEVCKVLARASHLIRDHEVEGLKELRAANKLMADAQQSFADVLYTDMDPTEKARIARNAIAAIWAADYQITEAEAERIATDCKAVMTEYKKAWAK